MDRLALVKQVVDDWQEKRAGVMTQTRRNALPTKSFAIPETKAKKIGVSGEIKGEAKGKYPIPDEKHARNALARVSQFGTPAEREAVRKKVYSKFPGLKEGFEQRHGESPTSKSNVKKEQQGGIGKAAEAVILESMMDELQKIAQNQALMKLASTGLSLVELIKVAEEEPEIAELLKESGLLSSLGGKLRNAYNAAQVGTGNLMMGSFGHAGEHAAHKLITTNSPTKALMVAAADPHAQKAVLQGAKKAGGYIKRRAGNLAQHTRSALAPVVGGGGPPMVPAFAG